MTATKAGAHDFLEKALSGDKPLLTAQNALSFARLHHENRGRRRRALTAAGPAPRAR